MHIILLSGVGMLSVVFSNFLMHQNLLIVFLCGAKMLRQLALCVTLSFPYDSVDRLQQIPTTMIVG